MAIVGFTGSGKTILAKSLVKQIWSPDRKIFLSDPLLAWNGWGKECHTIEEAHDVIQNSDDSIVRLCNPDEADQEQFCELAGASARSIFVMDESSSYLKRDLTYCWPALHRLTYHGRQHGQSIILLAQYFGSIPTGFRTSAYIFCSHVAEGGGQKWLKERAGYEPGTIPPYHWLVAAPDGQTGQIEPVPLEAETEPSQDQETAA